MREIERQKGKKTNKNGSWKMKMTGETDHLKGLKI